MRLWIDLANSPHVPFFRALAQEFVCRGHEVLYTARDFAQTVELARQAGLKFELIGGHGGRTLRGKAQNVAGRAWALTNWARARGIDLAVSHNSYSQTLAARLAGIKAVTLMDYEHQPANHLAFRLARRVIVPAAFPEAALRKFGAQHKTARYDGIKEDVYLADFTPDANFTDVLAELGVTAEDILIALRPPARDALYHRFENDLFAALLARLSNAPEAVKVICLPRGDAQRAQFSALPRERFIVPPRALDGANLIAHADLIVSAGGTMNREAAALGVPAATIYAGEWAALDEMLVRAGRLTRLATAADISELKLNKKPDPQLRRAANVRSQIADLILGS